MNNKIISNKTCKGMLILPCKDINDKLTTGYKQRHKLKTAYRPYAEKRRENRNFLLLFSFHIKHPAYTMKIFVKETTRVCFQTVSGLFTGRKRATFNAKVAHFLYASHRVTLSKPANGQPQPGFN